MEAITEQTARDLTAAIRDLTAAIKSGSTLQIQQPFDGSSVARAIVGGFEEQIAFNKKNRIPRKRVKQHGATTGKDR